MDGYLRRSPNGVMAPREKPIVIPPMTKIDVGQGAVLGFDWAENAVGWGRIADDRNEAKEKDDPKDEKF